MFYDIYIIIINVLEALFIMIGFFSCFYFVAWVGTKYEDRTRRKKKV